VQKARETEGMVCQQGLVHFSSKEKLLIVVTRHMLKDKEKKDYIDAELCLMSKPAKQKLPGAVTRFDELQALHQITTLYTHFVVSWVSVPLRFSGEIWNTSWSAGA
jgi:hypothetical protein